ncbi:uncharacterized protein FFE2_08587 [Fusarium fujikuroi]|uniref:Uncharacterized protein n=1 Tax=Fusarium fujikuroi TaxID=5127 RepID=A0A9Q9RTH8_FUSFU|nr:uncharacterized protein FFE2_08587 [Fusarium fujikuroi]VTT74598.1 unnamed protein product [Fusarium fujikuroi]
MQLVPLRKLLMGRVNNTAFCRSGKSLVDPSRVLHTHDLEIQQQSPESFGYQDSLTEGSPSTSLAIAVSESPKLTQQAVDPGVSPRQALKSVPVQKIDEKIDRKAERPKSIRSDRNPDAPGRLSFQTRDKSSLFHRRLLRLNGNSG